MSSIVPLESQTHSATVQLAEGWSLAALRSALRSGDARAIDGAVTGFYERCSVPLRSFCAGLIRQSAIGLAATGAEDLAVMAFTRVLELVKADTDQKITDEVHLVRLLFRVARCLFIDTVRLPDTRNSRLQSEPENERESESASEEPTPEEAAVGPEKDAFVALQLLFRDGERWGRMMRASKASERGYQQFRALALYEIAEKFHADLREATGTAGANATRRLYRQLAVREAGISTGDWIRIEKAVVESRDKSPDDSGLLPPLRDTANAICNVDLQNRNKIHSLRSQMGSFLAYYKGQWETIQDEL